MHIFKLVPVAFLMVYSSGCGCTEVSCQDGMSIELKKSSIAWEPGSYVFALDEDGKQSNCTVDLPFAKDPICTAGMQLSVVIAKPGGTDADAVPQRVITSSVATKVTLTVSRDRVEIAKGTYTPTFAANEPNGPTCGPTCQNATADLAVP